MRKLYPIILLFAAAGTASVVNAQNGLPELKPARLAIFKNGTFFIKREAEVAVKDRQAFFAPPKDVLLGTYWITVGRNAELRSASVYTDSITITRKVADMKDVIANSKGKNITIRRNPLGNSVTLREMTGTVLDYNRETNFLKMQLADGKVQVLQLNDLSEVVADASSAVDIKFEQARALTKIMLGQDIGTTTVSTLSLEKGMNWVPSYLFHVINDKEARLEMKATIVNNVDAAMKQMPVDLVVGNPYMFYGMQLDPACTLLIEDMEERKISSVMPMQVQMTNSVSTLPNITYNFSAPSDGGETGVDGEKSQDLYYFKLGVLDIDPLAKVLVPVFSQNVTYKDVYEVIVQPVTLDEYTRSFQYQSESPLEVYHSFHVLNNTKTPFTTGSVFVLNEKENPLAQDELKYTPIGAEGVIRLSKAIDVQAKNEEEVTDVVNNARLWRKNYYSRASIKGQMKVGNFQQKKIKLSMKKIINGDVTLAGSNGRITRIKGSSLNPTTVISWEIDLNPGEQQTIKYDYSTYVDVD